VRRLVPLEVGGAHYLPSIVDGGSEAVTATKRPEVTHS